jgi:hypothetical protein
MILVAYRNEVQSCPVLRVGESKAARVHNLEDRRGLVVNAISRLPTSTKDSDAHVTGFWLGLVVGLVGPEELVHADIEPQTIQLLASRSTDCALPTLVAYIRVVHMDNVSSDCEFVDLSGLTSISVPFTWGEKQAHARKLRFLFRIAWGDGKSR